MLFAGYRRIPGFTLKNFFSPREFKIRYAFTNFFIHSQNHYLFLVFIEYFFPDIIFSYKANLFLVKSFQWTHLK